MSRAYRLSLIGDASAVVGPRIARAAQLTVLVLAMGCASAAFADGGLPTGGNIVAGGGTIGQAGKGMIIDQSSQRLVIDWNSFSIGAGNSVKFVQPSANSVALNQVLGSDVSVIQGALTANGKVFLINPNGVLFSPTAQVSAGGLVASTLTLSTSDFLAGNYSFQGSSGNAIVNQGNIAAVNGGTIALIAAKITNTGTIDARAGAVLMGAGSQVTLDLGGTVKLQVQKGAIDALIENGGAIRANGGTIYLTASALGSLMHTVINNTGIIQAQTLSTGQKGEIYLLGDMQNGRTEVGGTLDASAPHGGDGGHIETSGAAVDTVTGLKIDAGAKTGMGGDWLIDPFNYTINAAAATNIDTALNSGTSVTVDTSTSNASYGGGASGAGDITVSSAVSKTAGGYASLTLNADRNIIINAPITSTSGALNIVLDAAARGGSSTGCGSGLSLCGGVVVNGNLISNGGAILMGGGYTTASYPSAFGIGYALNSDSASPAVTIDTGTQILSSGGNIILNGYSLVGSSSGGYNGTTGAIYINNGSTNSTPGAVIESGTGNLNFDGISAGGSHTFGISFSVTKSQPMTIGTSSTGGAMLINAVNTDGTNFYQSGAFGMASNGSQTGLIFIGNSVADLFLRINGSPTPFTYTNNGTVTCPSGFTNCGQLTYSGANSSYPDATFYVNSASLNPIFIETGNGSKTYDGTTNTTLYNASTNPSGLTLTALSGPSGFDPYSTLGTLVFTTPSKNVGSYIQLTAAAGDPTTYTTGGVLYAIAYYNVGTYTINPALLTVAASNKVYDGTSAASLTLGGVVSGDSVTFGYSSATFASPNAGTGITVTGSGLSLSGTDAGNYVFSNVTSGTVSTAATISKAPLTVTANGASQTYNGLGYSGGNGINYSGFVNGQTSSVLGGSLTYGGTSQGATNVGSYVITPGGLTSSNYAISFVNGALVINPAALTITANGASQTYNGLAYSGGNGVNYSGFVNGQTSSVLGGSLTYGGSSQGASNAGSYAITPGGLTSSNYAISFVNGALVINPAALTITANGASQTYNGSTFSGGNGVA